jgi:hypothetical protein
MRGLCILCLAFTAFAQSTPQFETAVVKLSPARAIQEQLGLRLESDS